VLVVNGIRAASDTLAGESAIRKRQSVLLGVVSEATRRRPSALAAIARKALARKTGARGLRSIMELSLNDTMFDLPTLDGVAKVVLDEHTIEENAKPLLVYHESKASA